MSTPSSPTYTLSDHVENLTFTGTGDPALNFTGSNAGNIIIGRAATTSSTAWAAPTSFAAMPATTSSTAAAATTC